MDYQSKCGIVYTLSRASSTHKCTLCHDRNGPKNHDETYLDSFFSASFVAFLANVATAFTAANDYAPDGVLMLVSAPYLGLWAKAFTATVAGKKHWGLFWVNRRDRWTAVSVHQSIYCVLPNKNTTETLGSLPTIGLRRRGTITPPFV